MQVELTPAEASEVRAALRSHADYLLMLAGGDSRDPRVVRLETLLERISPTTARSAKGASA